MKTIIQASSQHMKHETGIINQQDKHQNMKYQNKNHTIMIIKTMECQNNHKNDYYDKDMCIRSMINMIAKT